MLQWYAGNAVLQWLETPGLAATAPALESALGALDTRARARETSWENLGGQLAPSSKVEALLSKARSGSLRDWHAMHAEYARLAEEYPSDKAGHAWAVLRILSPAPAPAELLGSALRDLVKLSSQVEAHVYATRAKDHSNRFRKATFRSEAEMRAVVGCPEDNPFVVKTRRDMAALRGRASTLLARL
jgi:hypothetical protein